MSEELYVFYEDHGFRRDSFEEYGEWIEDHDIKLKYASLEVDDYLQKFEYDRVPVDGDIDPSKDVYVVVAYYSSGVSFGRSTGNVEFVVATQDYEKACEWYKALVEADDEGYYKSPCGKKLITPWFGYFERCESVEIEKLSFW